MLSSFESGLRDEIVNTLRLRGALFVSDLGASLADARERERALASLESEGAILVRDHACPDPHLEGEDLRVAGLVESIGGADRVASCVDAIETTWSAWLASFLAEHRCS